MIKVLKILSFPPTPNILYFKIKITSFEQPPHLSLPSVYFNPFLKTNNLIIINISLSHSVK